MRRLARLPGRMFVVARGPRAGLGVCSECALRVADWDRGDRTCTEESQMAQDMAWEQG